MNSLTPDELLAFLKAAKARSTRDWCMFVVGFRHGLRCSEIANLRVSSVNLRESTIRVERLKHSLTTVQTVCDHPGRPLLSERLALQSWLRQRPDDGSDFLFNSRKGGRLNRRSIYKVFRACAQAAGLPDSKSHPHCLKHTLGTMLARQGTSPFAIRQALGHRALSSTLRYTNISDAEASAATRSALMAIF